MGMQCLLQAAGEGEREAALELPLLHADAHVPHAAAAIIAQQKSLEMCMDPSISDDDGFHSASF